jgi:hypothetical protein
VFLLLLHLFDVDFQVSLELNCLKNEDEEELGIFTTSLVCVIYVTIIAS